MDRPPRSEFGIHWALDPGTTFLNHGSFGACPTAVLEEQSRLRALLESDPVDFYLSRGPALWQESIKTLSDFVGADPAGMTFQTNASSGVNTVLRSLALRPGDEIIVSDHVYRACRNAVDYACARSGASVVQVAIPFRPESAEQIVDLFLKAVTDRSRLALIDTVTSPTALRMPFERLTRSLQDRGVDVLVDAAHGPGLLPLDLGALGAAYVTGNCHKWLCTPKGSAFLHIRADRRHLIKPLTISHGHSAPIGADEKFRLEFDWQGTQDPTPWLCIPKAIEQVGGMMAGGWPDVMARNHALALKVHEVLCGTLGADALAPAAMTTAMVAARLPDGATVNPEAAFRPDPLRQALYDRYRIQAVVGPWPAHGARYLRVSAALYNSEDEYRYLASALRSLL
jgi:isopenicillin-N epimerase